MTEDEKLVRDSFCQVGYTDDEDGLEMFIMEAYCDTWFISWAEAAAFTRDRLEDIRQIKEEVNVIEGSLAQRGRGLGDSAYIQRWCRLSRILARLTEAMGDLKRGMKESK